MVTRRADDIGIHVRNMEFEKATSERGASKDMIDGFSPALIDARIALGFNQGFEGVRQPCGSEGRERS